MSSIAITNITKVSLSVYSIDFNSDFNLTDLFYELSSDGIVWSNPIKFLDEISPKNITVLNSINFYIRLSSNYNPPTIYSNIYNYINQIVSEQLGSPIPQEYYEDITQHGSYVYITLEEMVTNFLLNFTGDGTALGNIKRHQILFNFKKGIQQFSFNALKEVKAIELELGDAHDIILPPDYINYVRISWINEKTGELMPMSINDNAPLATSYMQDHKFEILFDSDGNIVEGTTMFDEINDRPKKATFLNCGTSCTGCQYYTNGCLNTTLWGLNTTKNNNGTFNINPRQGRIHFSSENVSRVIVLEYISDGLEYSNESDIKINKFAEIALYNYVNLNLLRVKDQIQEYKIIRAKKDYDTSYRNAKINLMNLRPSDLFHTLNSKKQWIH